MSAWTRATTAKADCHTTGIEVANPAYRAAMQRAVSLINAAYLAASEPAPHPVRWKRWLRRPYRKVDHRKYVAELHARKLASDGRRLRDD